MAQEKTERGVQLCTRIEKGKSETDSQAPAQSAKQETGQQTKWITGGKKLPSRREVLKNSIKMEGGVTNTVKGLDEERYKSVNGSSEKEVTGRKKVNFAKER